MEHSSQGLTRPPDSTAARERTTAREAEDPRAVVKPPGRQWIDPAIHQQRNESTGASGQATGHGQPAAGRDPAESSGARWIGPASVERRLAERAEQLWRKLAGDGDLPDSGRLTELLRPPFLGQSLLVETADTEAARIAFVGEALGALTGLRVDTPASPSAAATPFGARLVRLAAKSARLAAPCRYESDLPSIEKSSGDDKEQILTRAIALPFAAREPQAVGYSIVVVASWRKLLSAEETRVLYRELAAAIDWMHKQGS